MHHNSTRTTWHFLSLSGFRLEQRECEGKLRSYTLLEAETLIIVNHMVRLAGLRFSPGRPCGPPAEERAREALLYWPTDALLARGVLQ